MDPVGEEEADVEGGEDAEEEEVEPGHLHFVLRMKVFWKLCNNNYNSYTLHYGPNLPIKDWCFEKYAITTITDIHWGKLVKRLVYQTCHIKEFCQKIMCGGEQNHKFGGKSAKFLSWYVGVIKIWCFCKILQLFKTGTVLEKCWNVNSTINIQKSCSVCARFVEYIHSHLFQNPKDQSEYY